eukprot:m.187904 g.187904  ORF g.187904 m.187904 type:complete len:210 (+) comp39371_c1_seq5:1009-1638(+)
MDRYKKGIGLLERASVKNEAEEKVWKAELIKLYLNMATCCIKKHIGPKAITFCNKVRDFDRRNVKAFYCLGQAYRLLGEYDKARNMCLEAVKLRPNNEAIREELRLINRKKTDMEEIEKGLYRRMLGSWREEPEKESTQPAKESVSKEFVAIVTKQLETLKSGSRMSETLYPGTLSDCEMACIKRVADEVGLGSEYTETKPRELKVFQV